MRRRLQKIVNALYAPALVWAGLFSASLAHAAGSSGLPQLDASTFPSQLFWLAVTFGVLYFVFSKKTLPEISGTIESRRGHIQSDLDLAEKLKGEAQAAQDEYESSLQGARADASNIVSAIEEQMKIQTAQDYERFRERSEQEVKAAEERILAAKDSVMEEMNMIAADMAALATQKITGVSADSQQAQAIVKSLTGKARAA